jgi:hypothetical protein
MGFYLKFCATNFFMEIQHNNFCMIALRVRLNFTYVLEVVLQRWKGFISFLCIRIQFSLYTPITPAVFYMFTGLARCSVDPEISCSAHKLTRTSWVIKKKKKSTYNLFFCHTLNNYHNILLIHGILFDISYLLNLYQSGGLI